MLKERVLPADLFTVVNKTVLNDADKNIITMLYQPIIGADATSLYFSLCSYLDKLQIISSSLTHHHLMTNLMMRLDDIVSSREKLEAVGLVKTFIKKGDVNQFVYELYSPLSSKEFFNNPLLSTVLFNNIGESEYKNVLNYFKVPRIKLDGYEDITCKFQDIFEVSSITNFEQALADLRCNNKNNIEISSTINLENIISNIPEEMLNVRSITKDTKDFIYRISFVYGFNDDEMIELIKSSCNLKQTIDKDKLKENARNYYKFEHYGNLPSLALKTQPEYLRKKNSTTNLRDKKIYEFETTSPYDYLYSKHSGTRITKSETAILEYLLVEMNLNPGVVNVILEYVLKESDNKLVPSYVEDVAGLFSRNNIKTVEEAMELAGSEHRKRKAKKASKVVVKKEEKPEWLDKKQESIKSTDEEIEEMKKLINRVVK